MNWRYRKAPRTETEVYHEFLSASVSVVSMAAVSTPIMRTVFSQMPSLPHSIARLSAVWQPWSASSVAMAERSMSSWYPCGICSMLSGVSGHWVHAICRDRIGHDRDGLELTRATLDALFAEAAAGLGAGVIEFAGLADDDGAGADDEDGLDGGIFQLVRLIRLVRLVRLGGLGLAFSLVFSGSSNRCHDD